jgi:hypothetical protein
MTESKKDKVEADPKEYYEAQISRVGTASDDDVQETTNDTSEESEHVPKSGLELPPRPNHNTEEK